jgi:hypothetical protein
VKSSPRARSAPSACGPNGPRRVRSSRRASPTEITADIEKYRSMKPGVLTAPAERRGGRPGAAGPGSPTGTNPDGTMRFPPGVGTGEKGDANSPRRCAPAACAPSASSRSSGSRRAVPDDIAQTLYDLGSDLAPNGTIWATLAPAAGGGGAAAAAAAGPLTGANPDGTMRFPPGVGTGDKGDPNSPEKVRARRMRAERKFKELTDAAEAIPDDVAQTSTRRAATWPRREHLGEGASRRGCAGRRRTSHRRRHGPLTAIGRHRASPSAPGRDQLTRAARPPHARRAQGREALARGEAIPTMCSRPSRSSAAPCRNR